MDPKSRLRRSKAMNARRVEIPGRFPKMSSETKLPAFTVVIHRGRVHDPDAAIIQIIRIPLS